MGALKVVGKVSKDSSFAIAAYTTLEYLHEHGTLTGDMIQGEMAKAYPDLGAGAMEMVFDALVDSRLIAFMPSKGLYRLSQSGRLAFSIAKAVVKAVAKGDDEEQGESIH